MALPEVAPFNIVGTPRDGFSSTLGPNNVKDGTPDNRPLREGGTFNIRLLTFDSVGGRGSGIRHLVSGIRVGGGKQSGGRSPRCRLIIKVVTAV